VRLNSDDKYTGLGLESPFYTAYHNRNMSELEVRLMLEVAKSSLIQRMANNTHPRIHPNLEEVYQQYVVDVCTAWRGLN